MIPLLPFVGLGVASLLRYGVAYVWQTARQALPRYRIIAFGVASVALLVVAIPFVASLESTFRQVRNQFTTSIDPFLIDPDYARLAAEFVNTHAAPDDVVVASPTPAWLIEANVTDVQMATAVAGYAAPDLPAGIPADRFAFDSHYARARFVIVDNLWHNWAVWNVPGAPDVLREVETWPLAFEAGEIKVYENPR